MHRAAAHRPRRPARSYEVDVEIVLGRDSDGIVIDDKEVSRQHARVRAVEETLVIEDLGSTNGTFVNHERIVVVTTLRHGDLVRVGGTILEVDSVATARPSSRHR